MKLKKIKSPRLIFKGILLLSFALLLIMQGCVDEVAVRPLFTDTQIQLLEKIDAVKQPNLTIAVQALQKTGLANTLNTYGPFTFFAPDNQAFANYFAKKGVTNLDAIPTDELRRVLQYHIIQRKRRSAEFIQGTFPDSTVNGDYFEMDITNGVATGALINGVSKIYETNIEASNAIVHKIDQVLDPPVNTLADYINTTPNLSVLKKGMELAGLMDTLSTIRSINSRRPYTLNSPLKLRTQLTVFAETDDVFAADGITAATFEAMFVANPDMLKRLMRYHIMPGAPYTRQYQSETDYRTLGLGLTLAQLTANVTTYDTPGKITAVMLPTLQELYTKGTLTTPPVKLPTYDDVIYFEKNHPKQINRVANIKASGKDIFVKNGFIQLVDKIIFEKVSATVMRPFDTGDATKFPRISKVHEFEERWYAYGAPVNSNTPRVFGPERSSIYRQSTFFAFMVADSPGDSITTIIPGIQKGKYRIEFSFKNGDNRHENIQAVIGGKDIGSNFTMRGGSTHEQRRVIITNFEFKTSGTKRFTLRTNQNNSNRYEIAPDAVVLIPVP